MTGTMLAGAASNGTHAANGPAALFIATGQDAVNVAESHPRSATRGFWTRECRAVPWALAWLLL